MDADFLVMQGTRAQIKFILSYLSYPSIGIHMFDSIITEYPIGL